MLKNNFKKIFLNFLIVIFIFALDRVSKIYILNLVEVKNLNDFYINQFLNFHLIWNTGIGFGFLSSEINLYYNLVTFLIIIINIIILYLIFKSNNFNLFFLLMILGGSFGNLFDRIYYKAVPDFIDIHYNNFHWFIFNIADIFITIGIIMIIIKDLLVKNDKN